MEKAEEVPNHKIFQPNHFRVQFVHSPHTKNMSGTSTIALDQDYKHSLGAQFTRNYNREYPRFGSALVCSACWDMWPLWVWYRPHTQSYLDIILVSRSNSIWLLNTTSANSLCGLFRMDTWMLSISSTKSGSQIRCKPTYAYLHSLKVLPSEIVCLNTTSRSFSSPIHSGYVDPNSLPVHPASGTGGTGFGQPAAKKAKRFFNNSQMNKNYPAEGDGKTIWQYVISSSSHLTIFVCLKWQIHFSQIFPINVTCIPKLHGIAV